MKRSLVMLIALLALIIVGCDKEENNNNPPASVASVEVVFASSVINGYAAGSPSVPNYAYTLNGTTHELKIPNSANWPLEFPEAYRATVIARDSQGNALNLSGRTIVWNVPGMAFFNTVDNGSYLQFECTGDWFDNSGSIPTETKTLQVSVDGVQTSFDAKLFGIINVFNLGGMWHWTVNGSKGMIGSMIQIGDRLVELDGLGNFNPDSTPPPMINGNVINFQAGSVMYTGTFSDENTISGTHDGFNPKTWSAFRTP